jgi:hypothetical protein
MTIALNNVANLRVTKKTWAPGQAQVLEIQHEVKIDSNAILNEGDQVSYTDDDLGYAFFGKITDVKKNYVSGEGVTYVAADPYRTLIKQPAAVQCPSGITYKIRFKTGTLISTALNKLMTVATGYFPGGVQQTLADQSIPLKDKGGQTIDTWLNDILNCTAGGIAYSIPNNGNPKLIVADFYNQGSVTLEVGTYNTIQTTPNGNPALQSGSFGSTLNRKYRKVTIECGGSYKRRENVHLNADWSELAPGVFKAKWVIPEKYILSRFINADGKCDDDISATIQVGGGGPNSYTIQKGNMPYAKDANTGQLFFYMIFFLKGVSIGNPGTLPQIDAWFNYTSYEGPLVYSQTSADARLAGEGEIVEVHDDIFKYTSAAYSVDPTASVNTLLTSLFTKYCADVDKTGSVAVHINGLNPNIKPGVQITNFGGMRVRSIQYDFITRSMNLELSNLPLRDNVVTAKNEAVQRTLAGGNWAYNTGSPDITNCFSDKGYMVDETCTIVPIAPGMDDDAPPGDTNPPPPGGGGGGGGGQFKSWNCMPNGECWEVDGKGGAFKTKDECQRNCSDQLWYFTPCVGCGQGLKNGEAYPTSTECTTAHPNNKEGCKWKCWGPEYRPTCTEGIGDGYTYNDKASCVNACPEGSGSGSVPPPPSGSGSGGGETPFTGTCKFLCGVECGTDGKLTRKYTTQTFSIGKLTGCVSDCEYGCKGAS